MPKFTDAQIEAMQAEIERLKADLGISEQKRTEAEENSIAMAQAGMFSSNAEEQPTGRKVGIEVCVNPHVRDEKKHVWKTIEYPTYFYTIQLPLGAGIDLTTNGIPYFHGQTVEVDPFTLVDLKSRVARCWDHEKSIHGGNENAYRRPTQVSLVTRAAAQRGAQGVIAG